MTNTTDQFDFTKLSIPERIRLAQDIWDSVAADCETIALTEEQKAELDRRMEDYRKHPEQFSTWDEVKQRLQRRT